MYAFLDHLLEIDFSPEFRCPVCYFEKAKATLSRPLTNHTLVFHGTWYHIGNTTFVLMQHPCDRRGHSFTTLRTDEVGEMYKNSSFLEAPASNSTRPSGIVRIDQGFPEVNHEQDALSLIQETRGLQVDNETNASRFARGRISTFCLVLMLVI
jgi:hypothetical protein